MPKFSRVISLVLIVLGVIGLVYYFVNFQSSGMRRYIGKSREACAMIDFGCNERDEILFSDETGCGCQKSVPQFSLAAGKERKYYSTSPNTCESAYFSCEYDWKDFSDDSGCGCER